MTVVTAGLNRRTLLQAAAASTLSLPAIGQDMRARTLRMIPSANLSFIDPTISTAGVTISHGFAVFDCLYGVDAKNQPKPQMVEGHTVSDDSKIWTFTLRPGLKFHDGEPVRGQDCIASIKRWSARDSFGQALATFTDRMDSPDDRTFRIILTEGKNRQIRRMCSAFGYKVRRLQRLRIMNIQLGSLPVGKWRYLRAEEGF